jgi:hypothetical protein
MLYILSSILPLVFHFTTTLATSLPLHHSTGEKMFSILHIILYILSILAESLIYTITLPNNLAVAALQFQLILQARWNLFIMDFEIVAGEFLERSIRMLLGME